LAILADGDEEGQGDCAADGRKVTIDRPNVFLIYEQNVGLLTPIVAALIREAVATYPETWIRDAISVSVQSNRRNWRYIQRVLDRWARFWAAMRLGQMFTIMNAIAPIITERLSTT